MDSFKDATHYTTDAEALHAIGTEMVDGREHTILLFIDPGYNGSTISIATEMIDNFVVFTRAEYWRIVNGD